MSLRLEAVRDKPRGFWMMDGSSPLTDLSGRDKTATFTGTPSKHPSLVGGALYAPILTNATAVKFDTPVFRQGYEKTAFTLECFIRPVTNSSTQQQILGNTGAYDGILIQGTKIHFVTKYLTAGEARCTYDLQMNRAVSVMATHSEFKNSLYINGVLVSEVAITEEQKADSFVSTDDFLYSGQTTGLGTFAINGVSMYGSELNAESARRHYFNATNNSTNAQIAATFKGAHFPLNKNYADVYTETIWETSEDWKLMGTLANTTVENEQLVPQFQSGFSVAGNWSTTLPLGSLPALYGVGLTWDGEGVLVQTSIDNGDNWVTATRGVNISSVPPGTNPNNRILQIRVSFEGGIENDTSFMDSLVATIYKTGVAPTIEGRTITVVGGYFEQDHESEEYHDDWGLQLNGGSVTLAKVSGATTFNPETVEVWLRPQDSMTVNVEAGASTVYANGVTPAISMASGVWQLRTFVIPSGVSGNIVVSGTGQVGQITIYPYDMSTEQVRAVYDGFIGRQVTRAADVSVISIVEPADATEIYEYDWSIESAD